MKKYLKLCIFVLAVIMLASLNGCTGIISGNICKVLRDDAVTKSFENYQINPDYNYYMTGPDNYPRSILGLSKKYILNSDLWKEVDTKTESFSALTLRMRMRASEYFLFVDGYSIFDGKGKQIGVWYSVPTTGFWVRLVEKEAKVTTPADKQYEKYDGMEGKD